jgi:hypothetical protein
VDAGTGRAGVGEAGELGVAASEPSATDVSQRDDRGGYVITTDPYEVALAGTISSVSILFILQLLALPMLGTRLTIALYCFVFAIPVSSAALVGLLRSSAVVDPAFRGAQWIFVGVYVTAQVAFAAGMTAVMFHFSPTVGIVFIASFVIAVLAYSLGYQFR